MQWTETVKSYRKKQVESLWRNNKNCPHTKSANRRQVKRETRTPVDLTWSKYPEEIFGYLLERKI